MSGGWAQHQYGIIFFLLVILAIVIANLFALRRLGEFETPVSLPSLSALVPARNEELNIEACVSSLLSQDYPDFEVVVLDDDSSDRTGEILRSLAGEDERLKVMDGEDLPEDWVGKNWACHQLFSHSDGELVLFADADTQHDPGTLQAAAAAQAALNADLLTAFPHEDTVTWAEKLTVPILNWSTLCFVPLPLAHRLRAPGLSATIGQFMLFRREAYEKVGGHEAIKDQVADDFALGRRIKSEGLRWRLVDGGDKVRCRMYRDFRQAFRGLSKSLFPAFGYRVLFFLFVWLWLGVVFLEPPLVLLSGAVGLTGPATALWLATCEVALALVLWTLAVWRFRYPWYLAPLYPVILGISIVIALSSFFAYVLGRASWKGRSLLRPKLRWP